MKYSYETYKYPGKVEDEYVCPVLKSEPKTTEYYSRKSKSHLYEEFSSVSETDPETDAYYEEVSYTDSDEDAPGLDDVRYAIPSEHSICYQEEKSHHTCNCG